MIWLAALGGYLIGAIPFGLVITYAIGKGDLRQIGSGNIGATNVLRTGSKGAALATLILDAGKCGLTALFAGMAAGPQMALIAGAAAFLGHLFPIYLGFKGGKGVASYLGLLLALTPLTGLAACTLWLATAALTRISSLSALIATGLSPIAAWIFGADAKMIATFAGLSALIWARHHANIKRLLKGTEPKIGKKG